MICVWVWQLRNCQGWMEKIFLLSFVAFSLPHHVMWQRCFCCCAVYQPCCYVPLWSLWNIHALFGPCQPSTVYCQQWYSKSGSRSVCRPLAVCPGLLLWGALCLILTLPCYTYLLPYQLSHITICELLWDKIIWKQYTQQFWNTAHWRPFWLSMCSRALWYLWQNHSGDS